MEEATCNIGPVTKFCLYDLAGISEDVSALLAFVEQKIGAGRLTWLAFNSW